MYCLSFYICMCMLVAQSWLNLCDPMDSSLPGSRGILQLSVLEWVAIPFSRGSSRPRNQTLISCIAGCKQKNSRKYWFRISITDLKLLNDTDLTEVFSIADHFPVRIPLPLQKRHCCYDSVIKLCPTLCDPVDCSMQASLFLSIPEFEDISQIWTLQVHIHWISDAIQTSHPLSPSSPSAFSLSQH